MQLHIQINETSSISRLFVCLLDLPEARMMFIEKKGCNFKILKSLSAEKHVYFNVPLYKTCEKFCFMI